MDSHLTLGAHLLLWAFPLSLVILVAVDAIVSSKRPEDHS